MDAGDDERRRQVRARLLRTLRLLTDSFPDDPALDTAISRALLERVAAGELPETLRLARPGAMVAFGKQDAVAPGYADAARAARDHGFEAILRLAGGRAAVFHQGTLAIAHALPGDDLRSGVHDRFREAADRIAAALRALGVNARVGEVPGEYCPGGYSVNARGATKLAGVGQRLIRGGAHLGAVLVAEDAERVREPLVPVYEALGLDWDPATAGSVADEVTGVGLDQVIEAIRSEYARDYELTDAELDHQTLQLARSLAPEHASP
jgi:octanoyl-[GcvH]:protein N-octanoyltransferase